MSNNKNNNKRIYYLQLAMRGQCVSQISRQLGKRRAMGASRVSTMIECMLSLAGKILDRGNSEQHDTQPPAFTALSPQRERLVIRIPRQNARDSRGRGGLNLDRTRGRQAQPQKRGALNGSS